MSFPGDGAVPIATTVELGRIGKLAAITWHKLPHATGWQAKCPCLRVMTSAVLQGDGRVTCGATLYTPATAHRTMVQRCHTCRGWVQVP